MKIIYTVLFVLFLTGCTSDSNDLYSNFKVEILGKEISLFSTPTKGNSVSILEDGSVISLYSSGGIVAEGNMLSLAGNSWKGSEHLQWDNVEASAKVTAYCPPLPLNEKELYHNGKLLDILISKKEYAALSPIYLQFSHLFSQICFIVEPSLNNRLSKVIINPYTLVTKIQAHTGNIETQLLDENTTKEYSLVQQPRTDGKYSLLIPPSTNGKITLTLQTKEGKTLKKTLSNIQIDGGKSYICKISQKEERPGISTAEDFIAFTYLINHKSYKNRSLKEFGETKNGKTTYYLKNNIHFTNSERAKVLSIADRKFSTGEEPRFNDIFDGQGFYLDNLLIQAGNTLCCGLFQNVGINGVIKNLTVTHAENTCNQSVSVSLLIGRNEGMIDNCHVTHSTINQNNEGDIAALVAYNKGYIVNSSIHDINLHITNITNGIICFSGFTTINTQQAKIINCYASNITTNYTRKMTSKISCFTRFNQGIIENCVAHNYPTQFYPISQENKGWIQYCNYPIQDSGKMKELNSKRTKYNYGFENSLQGKQNTVLRLNNWIKNYGYTKYSQMSFKTWKLTSNELITFDSM